MAINIDEVAKNMREPKLRDIRAVSHIGDDLEREIQLISNITGISDLELDDLNYGEWKKLDDKLKDFFSPAGTNA